MPIVGLLLWAVALVAALLWPGHLIGPLDGAPLDAPLEAILIGLLLPILWMLNPRFLHGRSAKALIVAMVVWKVATVGLATQGGWCGEFLTPYAAPGSFRLDRSWDLRTYSWPSPPGCSAIVARGYDALTAFPAWSMNVPIDPDWILGAAGAIPIAVPPEPPRPPAGAYQMLVAGWLRPATPGVLTFDVGDEAQIAGFVDGGELPARRDGRVSVPLTAGDHNVSVSLTLAGEKWRFVPRWNDHDVFTVVPTWLHSPTAFDRAVQGWGTYVTPLLILTLLSLWGASAVRELRPNPGLVAWIALSTVTAVGLGTMNRDLVIRWSLLALIVAAVVPVAPRLRNWRGAVLLFGLPWLTLFATRSIPQVGHFTLFSLGDDWMTFQRFAYRIFMRGYWLQGGEPTFWYQPLYRWTTGVLHLAFGDSSVGNLYWDEFGLLIGAIFAFSVASRFVGFRAGVAAGAATLATVTLGPNWYVIGRGLSEISSSAWLFLAALNLMRTRDGAVRYGFLAGAFAVLAFLTRLNHLPLTLALVVFALPDSIPASSVFDWRLLWARLPKGPALAYLCSVCAGVAAFATRTWYYSGEFSVFAGTTRVHNGTGLGLTLASIFSGAAWRNAIESVWMIVSVQDPPKLDPRSALVVIGVACSALALLRMPLMRRLPLHLVVTCLAAIAGGLVARGIAYPGRFSIHLIPLAVTAAIATAALAIGPGRQEIVSD